MSRNIHTLLLMILVCAGCRQDHPLDQRTPQQAEVEIRAYTGIDFPSVQEVVGYRAGWEERFARVRMDRDALAEIRLQLAHCETNSLPRWIDGAAPSGIEHLWTPRDVAQPEVYTCLTPNNLGRACIVIDTAGNDPVTVYIYAFKA